MKIYLVKNISEFDERFVEKCISFFPEWRKDCKERGKENLAVSLKERFLHWLILCPIWMLPIIIKLKGE